MTEAIISLIVAILGVFGALITAHVIPFVKAKTTAEQRKQLVATVETLVTAAWQISAALGYGPEQRKAYVIGQLKNLGVDATVPEVNAIIEAAVLTLKNTLFIEFDYD
ncbi:MAG: phage holin family protein [Oscillospiraceae bacterium]|jgi:hypothetical protein|nr:phage holin family protein [Oscillospiraceae bacterium]